MISAFDYIGYYGPIFIFLSNLFFLRDKKYYMIMYVVFFILTIGLNKSLKYLIKDPRPFQDGKHVRNSSVDSIYSYNGSEKYGMPSGHAQMSFFSIVYLFLMIGNIPVFMTGFFITLIILYQRWLYRRHSIAQIMVGSLLGIGSGYLVFRLANSKKMKDFVGF